MSAVIGSNQSPRVTTAYLNDVNDPSPGVPLTSPSGSIVQPYAGQVGGKLTLNAKEAARLSDPAVGTLYGGVYQYVQFDPSSTASPARGLVLFWKDRDNMIVTPDGSATNIGKIAGICLNSVSKGNYGFMQILGKASVKMKNPITKGAPADGDLVVIDQTPGNTGDVLADATNLTSPLIKCTVGVAEGVPVSNTIGIVALGLTEFTY